MFLPFKKIFKEYVLPERISYNDPSDQVVVIVFKFLEKLFIGGGQRTTVREVQLGENLKLWIY